jgi:D-tyrosyl-tRNA(Tyr) deacylase
MKLLIQRVNKAFVTVENQIIGQISRGLLVFLGINNTDSDSLIPKMIDKLVNLRLFPQGEKEFDLSIQDIKGEILVVSQFTLYGNTASGRRPDFIQAAKADTAKVLYEQFVTELKKTNLNIQTGIFQADMKVNLENDGPASFILENNE